MSAHGVAIFGPDVSQRSDGRLRIILLQQFHSPETVTEVEENKIEANFDNVVLTIEVPKVEGAKPKQIPISGKKKIKAA